MNHYCIFRNIDSRELGLYMERCPERISPKRRDETITIPGRHGNLTITDDAFETYIRSVEFIVKDEKRIDEICAHFKGSEWLIFDTEPDRKYKARVTNQINMGTFESEPIITIFGSGNIMLYVNNQNVSLKEIIGSVTLDSEMKNAYNGATLFNHKMIGEFPILILGENNISWLGAVTKLEIQPNWRYV